MLGARAVTRSLPIFVSMAFKPSPHGFRTMMGVSPAQAAETLLEAGADVVGANCEITAEDMPGLVAEFRKATDAPLVMQPNAGQPHLTGGHPVYQETPESFASFMPAVVAAGAGVVGGCCGTTPARIAALSQALDAEGPVRRRVGERRDASCAEGRGEASGGEGRPDRIEDGRTACGAVISMGS